MQVDRRDACFGELLGELLGLVFGAHEQDAAAVARCEPVHELLLGFDTGDVEDVVRHRGDWRVGLVDRVQHLVAQEPVDEFVDAVVEGRGEQQALAAGRVSRPGCG